MRDCVVAPLVDGGSYGCGVKCLDVSVGEALGPPSVKGRAGDGGAPHDTRHPAVGAAAARAGQSFGVLVLKGCRHVPRVFLRLRDSPPEASETPETSVRTSQEVRRPVGTLGAGAALSPRSAAVRLRVTYGGRGHGCRLPGSLAEDGEVLCLPPQNSVCSESRESAC